MISHAFAHVFTQHLYTLSYILLYLRQFVGDNPRKENYGCKKESCCKEETCKEEGNKEESRKEDRKEEEKIIPFSILWIPKQRWLMPPLLCLFSLSCRAVSFFDTSERVYEARNPNPFIPDNGVFS